MRADTHVTFAIPATAPKAKCTFSQVRISKKNNFFRFTECVFLFQVVAALSVSLVSMVVGYVSAYTSPAAESMKEELKLTEDNVIHLKPSQYLQ